MPRMKHRIPYDIAKSYDLDTPAGRLASHVWACQYLGDTHTSDIAALLLERDALEREVHDLRAELADTAGEQLDLGLMHAVRTGARRVRQRVTDGWLRVVA